MTDGSFGEFGSVGAAAEESTAPSRRRLVLAFGVAGALSIALAYLPYGRTVIYPFSLFGTWAHEMGHGIGALITGNSFHELELYRSLGGVAVTSGADGLSQVVVSAAGLLGPAILGALVMIAGSRARSAPHVLNALAVLVLISTAIWIRNLFGFVAMVAIGLALGVIARFGSPTIRIIVAQLLAVQLALSAWTGRKYLFIDGFERDGWNVSDTGKIADELFLPHWFWGGLIGGLSIVILAWAFWYAWMRPLMARSDEQFVLRGGTA